MERALRKMAVQRQIDARLEADDANGKMIPITFTLSQLRKELASAGHDFKIAELREALDVLGRASLTVEGSWMMTLMPARRPSRFFSNGL